jgi:hypothetical protein
MFTPGSLDSSSAQDLHAVVRSAALIKGKRPTESEPNDLQLEPYSSSISSYQQNHPDYISSQLKLILFLYS